MGKEICMQALGEVMAIERIKAGLSQAELAEASGFARSFISAVELGKSDLSLESLYRIGIVLGIEISGAIEVVERIPRSRLELMRKTAISDRQKEQQSIATAKKAEKKASMRRKAPDEAFSGSKLGDAVIIEELLQPLRAKWAIAVLMELSTETMRSKQLEEKLPGLYRKTLSQTARQLEKHGLVRRESFREISRRVEYSITSKGRKVLDVLLDLKSVIS